MSSKKVGIITLPGNFNYGNRLQCYAMAELVRSIGCEPYVLERERCFSVPRCIYYKIKSTIQKILGTNSITAEQLRTAERTAAFSRFGQHIPTILISGEGFSCRETFDIILVGSDQVWNPSLINHQDKWFFATFAQPNQRIAVSASLGIDIFADAKHARRVANGVKGFSHVSVRELRGAELIKSCTGISVEVTCDPTMVLPVEAWRAVADNRMTPDGSYVFTYLLGESEMSTSNLLNQVTKHGATPVIPLSDRQKSGEPDAGPAEFISLIDHADHVVTDSFHAAVFASILQTPLTIVRREGGASMFSRLEQLSQTLGIEHKVFGSPGFDLSRAGDYKGVPEAIGRERDKFMGYLESCLNA